MLKRVATLALVLAVLWISLCGSRAQADTNSADEITLLKAKHLIAENRFSDGVAILERLDEKHPDDLRIVVLLANVLGGEAIRQSDPALSKKMALRARDLAQHAQKLGSDDAITPIIQQTFHEDGTFEKAKAGAFSDRREVDQAIGEGEAAFAKRDFAAAFSAYQRAAQLDPGNYNAALWAGDTQFTLKNYQEACDWYRKAIQISPTTETAHRYLGDALSHISTRDEAYNEWIAALLCQPYVKLTRQHFGSEMRGAAESRGRKIPKFPSSRIDLVDGKPKITLNPDFDVVMLSYNLAAVAWRTQSFSKFYPDEKTPRRSLPEELAAIDAMVEVGDSSPNTSDAVATLKKWKATVDELKVLKRDGLLEAYILLERADADLAKDYVPYFLTQREKLERYVRYYWCGFD